jgi:DNA-binding NarL/FixJ family response regulator
VARVTRHLDAGAQLRPDRVTMSIGGTSETARIRLLWMTGRWDDTLELGWATVFDLEQRDCFPSSAFIRCLLGEVAIDRGALDDAAAALAPVTPTIWSIDRNAAYVRARLAAARGDRDAARALLEAEAAAAERDGTGWKFAEILGLLTELALDDPPVAATWSRQLDALAERTGWLETEMVARRARAMARHSVDDARTADELAQAEGWLVEEAHAALLRGELDDDPAENLTRAYRLYDSWGAAPARRRAAAGLRARALNVPRRAAVADTLLTDTEQQMVRLVREGLSNRQIAAAMHYSVKTVEVYLSRVYTKTRCASRLELIRAVDSGQLALEGAPG